MDKKTLAVLAAAMLGLAACGGGSKGGSGKIITSSGDTVDNSGSQGSGNTGSSGNTNKPSDEENNAIRKGQYGFVYSYNLDPDAQDAGSPGTYDAINDLNLLQVDGRSIKLVPDDKKNEKFYRNNVPDAKAPYLGSGNDPYVKPHGAWSWIGNDLKNAKYGEIHDPYEHHYVFMQGNETQSNELPTDRKEVTYIGNGTHRYTKIAVQDDKPVVLDDRFLEADVEVKVKFGEKSLIGKISPRNVPDEIKNDVRDTIIKATIQDGRFSGTEKSHKTEVQGAFYGPNASEMAGAYVRKLPDDLKKLNAENYPTRGVFGATKQ